MMVSSRQTADERRISVMAAASTEFARSGYAGTSTDAIANRAGISQPYLFRLFGTKKDLFIATYDLVTDRIITELRQAGEGLEGHEAKEAMGSAYVELMQDPEMLQVELHGFAAAPSDPDIARSCRRTFQVLAEMVSERCQLTEDEVREFFAMGMLLNVVAAIDLVALNEPWAQNLCQIQDQDPAVPATAQALEAPRAERVESMEVPV
jgi:AcrR family transcriptional regulator